MSLLVERAGRAGTRVIDLAPPGAPPVVVGGPEPLLIGGPCSVESEEQALRIARRIAAAGGKVFRGGAWKPRTSPYSFQGLGRRGLEILATVHRETGLLICTEAIDTECLDEVAEVAHVIQVGSRNMDHTALLKRLGGIDRPVLLKRGFAATLDELLLAAEYLLAGGNQRVLLCERGIRTFADHSRNTLDLQAVLRLRPRTDLPVIVDPSHAAGRREWVAALARAGLAAGADGLIIEVHPQPERALSDGRQSLAPADFAALMADLRKVAAAVGRAGP